MSESKKTDQLSTPATTSESKHTTQLATPPAPTSKSESGPTPEIAGPQKLLDRYDAKAVNFSHSYEGVKFRRGFGLPYSAFTPVTPLADRISIAERPRAVSSAPRPEAARGALSESLSVGNVQPRAVISASKLEVAGSSRSVTESSSGNAIYSKSLERIKMRQALGKPGPALKPGTALPENPSADNVQPLVAPKQEILERSKSFSESSSANGPTGIHSKSLERIKFRRELGKPAPPVRPGTAPSEKSSATDAQLPIASSASGAAQSENPTADNDQEPGVSGDPEQDTAEPEPQLENPTRYRTPSPDVWQTAWDDNWKLERTWNAGLKDMRKQQGHITPDGVPEQMKTSKPEDVVKAKKDGKPRKASKSKKPVAEATSDEVKLEKNLKSKKPVVEDKSSEDDKASTTTFIDRLKHPSKGRSVQELKKQFQLNDIIRAARYRRLRPPIKDSSPEEDEEAFSEFEYISPKELQESPKEILARISARTEVGKAAGSGSSNKEDLSLELAQTIKPLPPAASEAIKRILKSRPIERTHSHPRNNSTGNESEIPSSAPSTAKPSKTKHQTLSNMQPKTVHFQEPVPAGGSRTKATPTPHINEGNATVDNARKLASSIKEAVSATPPEKAPPTRLPKRIGALAILYILFISTAAPIYIFIREHAGEPVVGELVIKLKYSVGSGAVVCVAIWVLQGTFDVLGYKMIGLIIGTLAGAIVWGFHSERAREGPQQLRLPW